MIICPIVTWTWNISAHPLTFGPRFWKSHLFLFRFSRHYSWHWSFRSIQKLNRTLMNFQQMSVSQYEYLQSFPPQYSLFWSISSLGSGGPMKIIGRKPAGPWNWLLSWPSWSGSLAAFIHIKLFFNWFLNKVICNDQSRAIWHDQMQ